MSDVYILFTVYITLFFYITSYNFISYNTKIKQKSMFLLFSFKNRKVGEIEDRSRTSYDEFFEKNYDT